MHRSGSAYWLISVAVTTCLLPLALQLGMSCAAWFMAWCDAHPPLALLLTGLVLLPLLASVALGAWAGVRQLWRTERVLSPLQVMTVPTLPSELQSLSRQLGIEGCVDLVVMPLPLAHCYGLLRPRICITTGLLALLTPSELEAVLQHERAHLQRRDPLRAWLWTVCDGICWWSPRASEEARLRYELAADQTVIQAGGRQALARAVLKLIDDTRARSNTASADLAISTLSATESRIDQLLQPERAASPGRISLSSRLAPLFGLCTLAVCLVGMTGLI